MLEKFPIAPSISTPTSTSTSNPSLRLRVEDRKAEIEADLAQASDDRIRQDLQDALSQVEGLLTGNLDKIPMVVAAELSKWLEVSKYLGEQHPSMAPAIEAKA